MDKEALAIEFSVDFEQCQCFVPSAEQLKWVSFK